MASKRDHGTSASTSAGPRNPILPPGLTEEEDKLNDSVWQLYAPSSGMHDMEIIFFHGLQMGDFEEAFWRTWRSLNDEVVWPKDWLCKRFPRARILSVSYNSSAKQIGGQLEAYPLGENLYSNIILEPNGIGQNCPVFLVGHCLGGIVIKEFILTVFRKLSLMNIELDQRRIEKVNTFLQNFKGAFFYGTPHSGSDEIPKFIESQLGSRFVLSNSPLLRLLKTLASETGRINDEFSHLRRKLHARTYGVAESLHTKAPGYNAVLVPEASVRNDVDNLYTHAADHFTVCKAKSMRDAVFGKLTGFIDDTLSNQNIDYQAAEVGIDMR